ncbi:uncharacterized protein BDV17DRAFT_86972 [Aspergillus undulatus]|uniref:uncharacterized protein n=1 Tax=Aspergillus undulatus TaxID=1810928 RepID=UPI003CCCD46A
MSSEPTSSTPALNFYDIEMRPPIEETACSPNPTKTRLALNFKNIPYKTTWVALPSVPDLRQSLGIPAGRKFADGTDFHTLPIIHDPSTKTYVGDSLDIAIYLDQTYPSEGVALFPAQPPQLNYTFQDVFGILIPLSDMSEEAKQEKYVAYAEFNRHVDAAFTTHTLLAVQRMPFHPATEKLSKAEFCRRAGKTSWDEFMISDEVRAQLKSSFKGTLGELAKVFTRNTSGPFVLGGRACYADLIVGGWLRMFNVCLPEDEWEELKSWHGGVFGQLWDALQEYMSIK